MRIRSAFLSCALVTLPAVATAQNPVRAAAAPQALYLVNGVPVQSAEAPFTSPAPVADAFRTEVQHRSKNLVDAAEIMPADKYGYKPTPAQMSFADVVVHLANGNDYFCGLIGDAKAPERAKVASTDSKEVLVERLKATFKFCDDALAKLDDSKLGETFQVFGRPMTRAMVMMIAADDWGDHYSQDAIYLRLNGLLPPTAKPKPAAAQ